MKNDPVSKRIPNSISYSSWADAFRGGVLVDVSELARRMGYDVPVAVTRRVWEEWIQPSESTEEGAAHRMRRILSVLWGKTRGTSTQYNLQVFLPVGGDRIVLADLAAFLEPVDTSDTVVTIMRLDEV